jgi:hypothetical protein
LTISVNKKLPKYNIKISLFRKVAINEKTKRALILDATSPYEADQNTFAASRKMKEEKYRPEEDALKKRGFDVINTAMICGALGAYDPKNDVVNLAAGVPDWWLRIKKRKLEANVIEVSKCTLWS